MKFLPYLSIAAITLLLIISAGCVTVQPDPNGTIWTLTSFGASDDAPHGIISLSFDNGLISGSTGINAYTGTYTNTLESGIMTVSTVSMTKMTGTAALTADETRYIEALYKTSAYTIQNGVLTLRDSAGTVLLTFGNPLADTSWRLVSYTQPGALTETAALGMVTASFAGDGTLTGSTGINAYSAVWKLNQSSLLIGSPSVSKALGPAALVSQEQSYLSLLGSVSGLSFSAGHLRLTNAAGETIMTFAPILADTSWVLSKINGSGLAAYYPDTTLILAGDGTFSGRSAVNSYFGEWHQTGHTSLAISRIGTTLLLGAPDVSAIEQTYLNILSDTTSFDITESDLLLTGKNGGTLFFTENYAETLKGTVWSLSDNAAVTLFIVDNGASLNGAAQINSYGADLTLTPSGDFSIRNFYSTKMSGPPSLMTEENQYFSRLASAASCTISSSQLILFDAYGTQILSFNPGI